MALPLAGIVATYVGAAITKRVTGLVSKIGLSSVLAGISYAVIALRVIIVGSVVYIIVWLFEAIQSLFDFTDTQVTSGGIDVTYALDVVKSLGIWDGFIDAFGLFTPVLVALLSVKLSMSGMRFLSDLHTVVREHIKIALSHGV